MDLTLSEYHQLEKLFGECGYADQDDMDLFPVGNHHNLYSFITSSLRMDCAAGRGPVYHFAEKLLQENKWMFHVHSTLKDTKLRNIAAMRINVARKYLKGESLRYYEIGVIDALIAVEKAKWTTTSTQTKNSPQ